MPNAHTPHKIPNNNYVFIDHCFQKYVAMPCHRPGQHDGGGGARPRPSGAGGQARGAGPGTLGTPGPQDQDLASDLSLNGTPWKLRGF